MTNTTTTPADLRAWCDAEREYRHVRTLGRFFGLLAFYAGERHLDDGGVFLDHYARSRTPWRGAVFASAFAEQQDIMVSHELIQRHGRAWARLADMPGPAYATAMACWY